MCKCAKCGGKSKVIDSREQPLSIRRRRECVKCKHRWNTYESELFGIAGHVSTFKKHINSLRGSSDAVAARYRHLEEEMISISDQLTAVLRENGMDPDFDLIRKHAADNKASAERNRKGWT